MKDRDNYEYSNRWVINTVRVLGVITQNAPECCRASDIAQILEIETADAEEILINLCLEEIVRETEHGFQTLGNRIGKLTLSSNQGLDVFLKDYYYGKMPRVRDANGRWL